MVTCFGLLKLVGVAWSIMRTLSPFCCLYCILRAGCMAQHLPTNGLASSVAASIRSLVATAAAIINPCWTCMHDQVPRRIQRWCSHAFGSLLGSSQPRRQVMPSQQTAPSAGRAGPSQPRHVSSTVASSLLRFCLLITSILCTCT